METPELIIVEKEEHEDLKQRSRLWWSGWVAAAIAFLIAAVLIVGALGVMRQLRAQAQVIDDLNERQRLVMKAQAETWQQQHDNIKLITGWAQYVRERAEISADNGVALQKAPSGSRRVVSK